MKTAKTHRNKRKKFDIHSLYPQDYRFDRQAFEADPENYVFTKEDIAYGNAMELERYEMETPMTPSEKRPAQVGGIRPQCHGAPAVKVRVRALQDPASGLP